MKFTFFKPRELEAVAVHKLSIVVEFWLCNPTAHHHTSFHMVFRRPLFSPRFLWVLMFFSFLFFWGGGQGARSGGVHREESGCEDC